MKLVIKFGSSPHGLRLLDFSCFSFLQVMVVVLHLYFALTCFLNMGDWFSRSNLTVIQNFVLLALLCQTRLLCCCSCLSYHIEGSCTYYMCYKKYINQEKMKTSCSWHRWFQFFILFLFQVSKEASTISTFYQEDVNNIRNCKETHDVPTIWYTVVSRYY